MHGVVPANAGDPVRRFVSNYIKGLRPSIDFKRLRLLVPRFRGDDAVPDELPP